jgi:putative inorganic carbon (HCO3(-)) transporter
VPEQFFVKMLPSFTKAIPWHNWKLSGAELGINPNALAGSLCLVIPVALGLLFSGKARAAWIALLGIISFIFLAVIFLSQAVGAWIALFLSLVLIVLKNRTWVWILFGSALLLILILLVPSNRTLVWKKIEQRSELWSTGVTTIQKHPIFGVGMNRLRYDNKIGYKHAHAHNQLIHTAAELGIPGLVAYLAILIGAAWMCVEVSKRAKTAWMRAAARGLGTGQLAFLIFGMGDAIPLGAKTGVFFWGSLALITAIYKHVARQENAKR